MKEVTRDDALVHGLVPLTSLLEIEHPSARNLVAKACLMWELREFLSNSGILYSRALGGGALRSQGKAFLGDKRGSEGTGMKVQVLEAEAPRLLLGIPLPAL